MAISYSVQMKDWTSAEKLDGSKMGVYRRVLKLMSADTLKSWHVELQAGRKDAGRFIKPIIEKGLQFETSMSGIRAERYTDRLLSIAQQLGEVKSFTKEGADDEPTPLKPKAKPASKPKATTSTMDKPKVEPLPKVLYLPAPASIEPPVIEDAEPPKPKEVRPKWFGKALKYLENGLNLYLYGDAGTGKGYNSRKIAKELNPDLTEHQSFYQMNKVGDEYQLLGFNNANGQYVKTRFYEACKFAVEHPSAKPIFMFDEMDVSSPDALKTFNEAVASKEITFPNGEFLQFPNLLFVAAGNTLGNGSTEKYTANVIDKSTLDRYAIIKTEYERAVEENITNGDTALCDFIDAFRREVENCNLAVIVSYRSLERLFKMQNSEIEWNVLLDDCLLKGMSADDVQMICNNIGDINAWTAALMLCAEHR